MTKRATAGGPEGILLIDKEPGWTSHDVVAKARRLTGQRRIGHTGTLDPAATGLLVLCLGRATRLVEYMSGQDKVYEGALALGARTDTDDADGEIVEERPIPELDDATLDDVAATFRGEISQLPPAYSAVKVEGKRAYALARKGESPELKPRTVRIDELELEARGNGEVGIRVACGAGTYIRSLARDIGEALGCGGYLANLRRTATGPFVIDEAVSLTGVGALIEAGELHRAVRPMDEGVMDLGAVVLANERRGFLEQGRQLTVRTEPWWPAEKARVYGIDGRFAGIGRVTESGELRPVKMLG